MAAEPPNSLIRGHIHVARMAYEQGDYHAALRNLNSAKYELQQSNLQLEDADLHQMKHLFGKVYFGLEMYKEAGESFEQAHSVSKGKFDEAGALSDMRHLADCLRLTHKVEEAEQLYKECIAQIKPCSSNDLLAAKTKMGLAQAYLDGTKLKEAEAVLQSALHLFERTEGKNSFWYARCFMVTARLRFAEGKLVEAREILQESLALIEPLIGPHHPLRAFALSRLAKLVVMQGNGKEARQMFEQVEKIEHYLRQNDV